MSNSVKGKRDTFGNKEQNYSRAIDLNEVLKFNTKFQCRML